MKHLEYVLAVAEEQNVTRAAERLYITQPALTRYLNNLEEEYGIAIFDRSKNPVQVTEAGRLFIREQTQLALREQALRDRLKAMAEQRVTLRIGSGHTRGSRLLPDIVAAFARAHPDVDVEIVLAGELELPELLESGKLDLAFGAFETQRVELETHSLEIEQMGLLVPCCLGILPEGLDLWASFEAPCLIQPEVLNGLPTVVPSAALGSYSSYRILTQQFAIRPGRTITASSAAVVRELVRRGMGYAYCSVPDPKKLATDGRELTVANCTLPGLPTFRRSSLAYRRDHPAAPLLEELAQAILAVSQK